jgi:hypothetical protein
MNITIKEIRKLVNEALEEWIEKNSLANDIDEEDAPSQTPSATRKRLKSIGGKKFATKVKRGFQWADDPEAAAATAMRKAGHDPRKG